MAIFGLLMDRESEFGRLYDLHRDSVHAYFVGRTNDRWLAADLTQEVFLRAWRQLSLLLSRSVDGQRAWLFTVARNLSIDTLRAHRTLVDTAAAVRRQPCVEVASADVAVVAADRVAVVSAAIRRLPEAQRVALSMAAAGGLTSSEIAGALGVAAGTVRYRLSLARGALGAALAEYDLAGTEES
jgi:RNA polymerase sigma-70 factor (ECF subfamily)